MFWTETQQCFWDDFYNEPAHLKRGILVLPKALNVDYHNLYVATDFRFIDEALKKMDIFV